MPYAARVPSFASPPCADDFARCRTKSCSVSVAIRKFVYVEEMPRFLRPRASTLRHNGIYIVRWKELPLIYTVTLNPAIDYVMHPLTLDMGFTNRSSSEELYCGGNGINVSTLLNELKVVNVAFGIVAGIAKMMRSKG